MGFLLYWPRIFHLFYFIYNILGNSDNLCFRMGYIEYSKLDLRLYYFQLSFSTVHKMIQPSKKNGFWLYSFIVPFFTIQK